MRHAPYGRSLAREGLDALMASAVFDQDLSLLFINDGVFQLKESQNTESIRQKNLEKMLAALSLYGVNDILVDQQALEQRQLSVEDLSLPVITLSATEIADLFQQQHVIFQF